MSHLPAHREYAIDIGKDWKGASMRPVGQTSLLDQAIGQTYLLQEPMIDFVRRWVASTVTFPVEAFAKGKVCVLVSSTRASISPSDLLGSAVLRRKTGGAESGFWWEVVTPREKLGELSFCPKAKWLLGITPETQCVALVLTETAFVSEPVKALVEA